MSIKKGEFELLKEEVFQQEPQPSRRTKGPEGRLHRMRKGEKAKSTGKTMISIRIDDELLSNFKELAQGKGYQSLINQALKEWWLAKGIKELVAQELQVLSDRVCSKVEEKLNIES